MKKILLTILLVTLAGCAKVQNVTDDPNGGTEATLTCGVVTGNGDKLESTVNTSDGQVANVVSYYSANTVAIQLKKDDGTFADAILVKLQGVKDTPVSKRAGAISRLQYLTSGTVYFFPASEDCSTTASGGGQGAVGALITSNSLSVGEELVKAGLADVETNDACGGNLIGSCLQAIAGTELETYGELDSFLWKPEADSDGRLAIHSGPYGVDVYVNGEKGSNQGPGNGYGSLARFSKPGCGYSNPQIQVVDQDTGLPYTVGGSATFTVPNPCGRYCIKDGSIQDCPKS